jgi:hypothetical protein
VAFLEGCAPAAGNPENFVHVYIAGGGELINGAWVRRFLDIFEHRSCQFVPKFSVHPTLVLVNVWHADSGLRPPGGGWTGAIPLRSIVPCRRPTKTGMVGQWRRLGKPQASPNVFLRRIAPFYAWDFHFISISFAAM